MTPISAFSLQRAGGLLALAALYTLNCAAQVSVTTYHYDNYRTGWNSQEKALTPTVVSGSSFGLRHKIDLDGQVDAQPLVVPNVSITVGSNQGTHEVVYVVTSMNSVYAIDPHTGTILINVNFGQAVTQPLGCNNNANTVGITSTPVIDASSGTLYVMVYNQESNGQAYYLHALDLGSLTDKMTPQLVTGSHTLTDGTTFTFNAHVQRQRPGLVLANGNVYAGFGSFCDYAANVSRGWLLGWNAATLTPLAANQVLDLQSSSPDDFFLSSIWMSGYAPAVDDSGNILFVTGNSDYSGTTYDGVTNVQESAVKVSPTLSQMLDLFTPANWSTLDQDDTDFGSGGVLVLPDQAGSIPHIAVAAGKDGWMYVLNEDDLGGYSPGNANALGFYNIGGCWCGQSYSLGPDGNPRIVSSGGNTVGVWQVSTSPKVTLKHISQSAALPGGQNPGVFTTISSNGNANQIIWALSHPTAPGSAPISLYAFNPESSMSTLFQGVAGEWPNFYGNSNLVPVVANGQVFVGSYKQLRIFGVKK